MPDHFGTLCIKGLFNMIYVKNPKITMILLKRFSKQLIKMQKDFQIKINYRTIIYRTKCFRIFFETERSCFKKSRQRQGNLFVEDHIAKATEQLQDKSYHKLKILLSNILKSSMMLEEKLRKRELLSNSTRSKPSFD